MACTSNGVLLTPRVEQKLKGKQPNKSASSLVCLLKLAAAGRKQIIVAVGSLTTRHSNAARVSSEVQIRGQLDIRTSAVIVFNKFACGDRTSHRLALLCLRSNYLFYIGLHA